MSNTLKARLESTDSFATPLLVILLDTYGIEAVDWAPETILMELQADFNVQLPPANVAKLLAAIHVLTAPDDFYQRLPVFIQLCNAMCGEELDPGTFDAADPLECAWGMTEAMLLSPPEEEEPYSTEIRYYLGAVCEAQGIRNPPDLLRLALWDTRSGKADYGDLGEGDPLLMKAQFGQEADAAQEIKEELEQRLQAMFDQLGGLTLKEGRTQGLLERYRRALRK